MEPCAKCGKPTDLFIGPRPICTSCDDERERAERDQQPKNDPKPDQDDGLETAILDLTYGESPDEIRQSLMIENESYLRKNKKV